MKLSRNKYRAKTVELDGYTFASKKEARRYQELLMLQGVGEIRHLTVHPRFSLLAWYHETGHALKIGRYTADTMYETKDGVKVVEDVKSSATKTTAYMLRKKLMKANYGIDLQEY